MGYNGGFMQKFLLVRKKRKMYEHRSKEGVNRTHYDEKDKFQLIRSENFRMGRILLSLGIFFFVGLIVLGIYKYDQYEKSKANQVIDHSEQERQQKFESMCSSGAYYFQHKEFDLALNFYEEAAKLYPTSDSVQHRISQCKDSLK